MRKSKRINKKKNPKAVGPGEDEVEYTEEENDNENDPANEDLIV